MYANQSIESYLSNTLAKRWTHPPPLTDIPIRKKPNTKVFELSLDTGDGTCKLMGKLIREKGNQTVSDKLKEFKTKTQNFFVHSVHTAKKSGAF